MIATKPLPRLRPSTLFRAGADLALSIVDIDGASRRFELRRGQGLRIPAHRSLTIDVAVGAILGGAAHVDVGDALRPLEIVEVDALIVRPGRGTRELGAHIARLETLRALRIVGAGWLHDPDVTPKGPHALEELALEQSWLFGRRTWAAIARFPRLRKLSVRHSWSIGDDGIEEINRLDGLEELDVSFTGVTGAGVCALRLPLLRELSLRGLQVHAAAFAHLATMKRLAHVDLRFAQVRGVERLPSHVVTSRTDPRIRIDAIDGFPAEAIGDVNGTDFTFRVRGDRWRFTAGAFVVDEFLLGASRMSLDDALRLIERAAMQKLKP